VKPFVALPGNALIDRYNRQLNYLRLSITDRCNLRCTYCVPPGFFPKLPHKEILRYEEILRLVKIAVRLGVSKVRVTGGEPLVRKGFHGFLDALGGLEGLEDISLTTNGVFLAENLSRIQMAGIRRINISLDTLQREKYKKITGFDRFDAVWKGIRTSREAGFHPIKINVVVIRGINEDELTDFARLSMDQPFFIRFIEHMPIGGNQCTNIRQQLLAPEILNAVEEVGPLEPIFRNKNDGPAERYRFTGAVGEIGLIRPISHHFCGECNRLRLTASGRLRVCLLSGDAVDLKGPMRNGATDAELARIMVQAVRRKPQEHRLHCKKASDLSDPMSAIGG
jgi:cyclic pyranopterin phosphate synthase